MMSNTIIPIDKSLRILPLTVLLSVTLIAQSTKPIHSKAIPHLEKQGTTTQLIVDGKPFLMLAGETGNSSASSIDYMNTIWPKVVTMNLNTLLVPVYWELIEPVEGNYDFTLVDNVILSARKHKMRIVFLWFGTWKNSMSCYAPYWVKTDQSRFPRSRSRQGRAEEIVTPFSTACMNADAKIFAALMKHIRTFDEQLHTVLMMQVENEIGMLPDARDYCTEANSAFAANVPDELMRYLENHKNNLVPEFFEVWKQNGFKSSGTWEEVFGKGLHTDEIFMAWYFGKYTNAVTEAGKKEYPLPMFVNAALIRPNYKPGQYPSAGPLPHLFDIWKAAAPQIDFLSPDIYFKSFAEWTAKFDRQGNAMFIPEVGNDQSVVNAFYAFAQHNSMGYSPFSIESLDNPENNQVAKGYNVLKQLTPLILANQGKGVMAGVLLDSADQKAQIKLGKYIFNVSHEYSWRYAARTEGENPRFGGMIIMLSPDEYLIAGRGLIVTFQTNADENSIAGIASLDEGTFVDGKWVTGLRMNGDQSHQGRHMNLPGYKFSMQKVKLYTYK
ncbi:MAG: DUF5597 domain-containing protein [bacterium]